MMIWLGRRALIRLNYWNRAAGLTKDVDMSHNCQRRRELQLKRDSYDPVLVAGFMIVYEGVGAGAGAGAGVVSSFSRSPNRTP